MAVSAGGTELADHAVLPGVSIGTPGRKASHRAGRRPAYPLCSITNWSLGRRVSELTYVPIVATVR